METDQEPGTAGEDVGEDMEGVQSKDIEDDHDSSSSDDEDEDEDEENELSPANMKQIIFLESALQANPNNYDLHFQYVEVLSRTNLKERARAARQQMQQRFPLPEPVWVAWINDELEQVTDVDGVFGIQKLYEDALQDYLSVNLWALYLEFVRDLDPEVQTHSKEGLAKLRSLCERAITAAGLHPTEADRLWNIWREFEMGLQGSDTGDNKAQERVRSLFHRQLAVPLAGGPATFEAYTEWETGNGQAIPPHVQRTYDSAQAALSLRQPYEAAISAGQEANAQLLAAYVGYVKFEQTPQGNPARVQLLYERAVATFPVTVELWRQYGQYLDEHLKLPAVVAAVYRRAVRNCPWSGPLWAAALRALERGGAPQEQHEEVYNGALQAGMQTAEDYMEVILARADFLRRRNDGAVLGAREPLSGFFEAATQLLASYFPDYLDRSLRLPAYWAHVMAHGLGDRAAARQAWEATLKTAHGRYYETWASYIAMERALRAIPEARALYRRAYTRQLEEGRQATLCADWLRFEREEGSAEDLFAAGLKVGPILEKAAAAAAGGGGGQEQAVAGRGRMARGQQPPQGPPAGGASGKPGKAAAKQPPKRRQDEAPAAQQAQKRQRGGDTPPPAAAKAPAAAAAAGEGAPQDEQMAEAGAGAEGEAAAAPPQAPPETHTVFVKGLGNISNNEELEGLLGPCGEILSIRIPREPDGRCRGFAYVEFASEAAMQAAVAMNGTEFIGRRLLIARSAPPGADREGGGRARGRWGRGGQDGRGRGRFDRGDDGGWGDRGRGRGRWGDDGGQGDRGRGRFADRGGGGRGHAGLGFRGRGRDEEERGWGRGGDRGEGYGGGRGRWQADNDQPPTGHRRSHLEVEAKPPTTFMPRVLASKPAGGPPPKNNNEFRKMLLGKDKDS